MGAPASGLLLRLRVSWQTLRLAVIILLTYPICCCRIVSCCSASGTSMGKDVMQAVEKIAMDQGGELVAADAAFMPRLSPTFSSVGMGEEEAKAYVKQMQSSGRYIQELWS